ncbi:MAG: putative mariner mos1 transposase, partial [Streblomastix strix]
YYDFPVGTQWVPRGTQRLQTERRTVASKKIMLTAMFTGSTFWLLDFKPGKGGINADQYINEILKTVEQDMLIDLDNAESGVQLHIDNAPCHNAIITRNYIDESIFERVPHPPYSPDLAPSDFWLFGELKGRMRGQTFATTDELATFCTNFADMQTPAKLKRIFEEWEQRCLTIMNNGGEYIF